MTRVSEKSWQELCRIATNCGLYLEEGARHTVVKDKKNKKITQIPRHNKIKKPTVASILKDLREAGCKI